MVVTYTSTTYLSLHSFSLFPLDFSFPDHGWFFAKMNMTSIIVLDYFGGVKTVSVKDYFNTDIWPLGH